MAAANTDKWRKKKSNFSTTLNGAIGAADATITLSSTAGLPTDTAITLTIDRVDANGVSTPTLKERVTGVVSGNNLTNCLRGEDGDGGVGKSHSSGAVVEDIWDADTWNDAAASFLTEHNQNGTHLNTIVALLAGAQAFTGAKTFGAGLLIVTDLTKGAATLSLPTATDTLVGRATTDTFTNKRNTPRITTITSSATPTINTDNCDLVTITALGVAITSMTSGLSGTPNNGDKLLIRFKDDGTGRAITWGTSYASRGATLPTTTTASKVTTVGLIYNSVTSTWDCVAAVTEA